MSLKKHHNKRYYYRAHREGNRHVTEYLGNSPTAQSLAAQAARDAAQRAKDLAAERAAQSRFDRMNRLIAHYEEQLRILVAAHMLVNGYYMHHRQWRKKRVKPTKPQKTH